MRAGLLLLVAACAADDRVVPLRFTPDPGPGGEQYQCFGFDLSLLGGADLGGVRYIAADSPVTVHHTSVWAARSPFPDGPIECHEMPADAFAISVWVAGSGDLELPPDLSLVIPEGTQRLVVQTHSLRFADGPAAERVVELVPRAPAQHRAGWFELRAEVPVIQPFARAEAYSQCTLVEGMHVISAWPHMHRLGMEFHGLVDVMPFQADHQLTYPLDLELSAGDVIGTHCVWQNSTDARVLGGYGVNDEMCGQAAIVYPHTAARCTAVISFP